MRAPVRPRTTSIHGIACFYQAVARISGHVRRRWASLVVDELPGGNHRRERAGAYVATYRSGRFRPSSPSACRAAASLPLNHSEWHAAWNRTRISSLAMSAGCTYGRWRQRPQSIQHAGVAGLCAKRHFDRAAHGVDHASELDEASIPGSLDDAAVMGVDRGVDQIAAQPSQPRQCAILIHARNRQHRRPRIAASLRVSPMAHSLGVT